MKGIPNSLKSIAASRAVKHDERSYDDDAPSADETFGELVSWVVGRGHERPGRSKSDTAVGELLSWVVGRQRR